MKNKTYKESEELIMSENMKKFMELVSKDENLKQKLQSFSDMEPADAISAGIALAKEFGIELTEADFDRKKSDGELSDDELDAVAGGGGCGCPGVGGGHGINRNNYNYDCGCVVYGAGGDGANCDCFLVGGGTDEGL